MTTSHAVDAGQDPPGRRQPRSGTAGRRRRRLRVLLLVLALLVVAVVSDAALVASRVDRLDVTLAAGDDQTWVLLGVDSRAHLPAGASATAFGTTDQVPGSRADVIVVVHQSDHGTTALSVPRDLLVQSEGGVNRLALTWLDGPEATVDALCTIGIPTDHLVTVDLAGFAAVVDAAGGLDVDVPEPVRDRSAGLELTRAGRHHVDGETALALIRSRHPEHLVNGQWATAPVDPDGRASSAGTVLSALLTQVRGSFLRPWRLQAVAWAASDAVAVDHDTSVTDLISLAAADLGQVAVLPVSDPVGATISRLPTRATSDAVRAAGLSCEH